MPINIFIMAEQIFDWYSIIINLLFRVSFYSCSRRRPFSLCVFSIHRHIYWRFKKLFEGLFSTFSASFFSFFPVFIAFSILDGAISIYFSSLYIWWRTQRIKRRGKNAERRNNVDNFAGLLIFVSLTVKGSLFSLFSPLYFRPLVDRVNKKLKAGKVFLVLSPFQTRIGSHFFGGLEKKGMKSGINLPDKNSLSITVIEEKRERRDKTIECRNLSSKVTHKGEKNMAIEARLEEIFPSSNLPILASLILTHRELFCDFKKSRNLRVFFHCQFYWIGDFLLNFILPPIQAVPKCSARLLINQIAIFFSIACCCYINEPLLLCLCRQLRWIYEAARCCHDMIYSVLVNCKFSSYQILFQPLADERASNRPIFWAFLLLAHEIKWQAGSFNQLKKGK